MTLYEFHLFQTYTTARFHIQQELIAGVIFDYHCNKYINMKNVLFLLKKSLDPVS